MREKALDSFLRLEKYCKSQEFKGWDPYDGLTSKVFKKIPGASKSRLSRLIWIQLLKKLPFNLRPVLGIEKSYNAKGLGLFISAYSSLSKIDRYRDHSLKQIDTFSKRVLEMRTPGYSGNCWGYNFDWESRAFFQKKNAPTIVATTFVANSLLDAYEATGQEALLNEAISSKEFILKDLNRTYAEDRSFAFSYSPKDQTSVFNASLLGARLLSRIYYYTKDETLLEVTKKAVEYCCNFQNEDGSWFYSTLPFHQWIDNFHTGFNLECISDYGKYTGDQSFKKNFDRGLEYYLNTFFDAEVRSKYYNKSLYPIDIHAPAQLIITLKKSNLLDTRSEVAERVLNWTIDNMQSSKNHFYFQINKYYVNKISYMRWSQAWIFYALATYIAHFEEKDPSRN